MGYDYYILIQGKKNEDWYTIDYKSCGGTYVAVDNHYFYTEKERTRNVSSCEIEYSQDMGEFQYEFSYETMKDDYEKYSFNKDKPQALVDIKHHIKNILDKELTYDVIVGLKDYLKGFTDDLDHSSRGVTEGYFNELKNYFGQCMKYKEHYDDVRIIFGLSP